jgi:hypothetical protein
VAQDVKGVSGMLIDAFLTPCVLRTPTRTDDGEGGTVDTWTDGARFSAAIVKDDSRDNNIGERSLASDTYTITVKDGPALPYHSVIKREADGRTFRVISDEADTMPPRCASFTFRQVKAEHLEET